MRSVIPNAGDKIDINGKIAIIGEVLSWDLYRGNYDIEFINSFGKYCRWKQNQDGGHLVMIDKEEK